MLRLATLLVLVLLAQSINAGRSSSTAPGPSAVHVDRHVDAHLAAPQRTPAANPAESPSRDSAAPAPATGTDALQRSPTPPAIQLYRDPLFRDRR